MYISGLEERPLTAKPCLFQPLWRSSLCIGSLYVSVDRLLKRRLLAFRGAGRSLKILQLDGGPRLIEGIWGSGAAGESAGESASHPSTACGRCHSPEQLSFMGALRRSDDAEACPLSILCNTTSKKLIMELIRANPHWNVKLDRGWLLRDVFILWEEKVWKYSAGTEEGKCVKQNASTAPCIRTACRIWTPQTSSKSYSFLFPSSLLSNKHNSMRIPPKICADLNHIYR